MGSCPDTDIDSNSLMSFPYLPVLPGLVTFFLTMNKLKEQRLKESYVLVRVQFLTVGYLNSTHAQCR